MSEESHCFGHIHDHLALRELCASLENMTCTDDIRHRFYLAKAFKGFEVAGRIARALAEADVGIVSIHDLVNLTLSQLHQKMVKAHLSDRDQQVLLWQMRESKIYPRGVSDPREFGLD